MGQRGTISQGSGRSESDIELDQRQYQESEVAQVRFSPDTRTPGAYIGGRRGETEAGEESAELAGFRRAGRDSQ